MRYAHPQERRKAEAMQRLQKANAAAEIAEFERVRTLAIELLRAGGSAIGKNFELWFGCPESWLRVRWIFGRREIDFKRGTLSFARARRGDRTAVHFDEVAHDGETKTQSTVFPSGSAV